jgi:hypothetical protein
MSWWGCFWFLSCSVELAAFSGYNRDVLFTVGRQIRHHNPLANRATEERLHWVFISKFPVQVTIFSISFEKEIGYTDIPRLFAGEKDLFRAASF